MKLTDQDIAIIKGMLDRGDKQQWIVAWFGGDFNSGRIAEINTGQRGSNVPAAPRSKLPPIGPYVSGQSAHRALLALGPVKAALERSLTAIDAAIKALSVMDEKENGQ